MTLWSGRSTSQRCRHGAFKIWTGEDQRYDRSIGRWRMAKKPWYLTVRTRRDNTRSIQFDLTVLEPHPRIAGIQVPIVCRRAVTNETRKVMRGVMLCPKEIIVPFGARERYRWLQEVADLIAFPMDFDVDPEEAVGAWHLQCEKNLTEHLENCTGCPDCSVVNRQRLRAAPNPDLCVICWDGPRDHIIAPCGHICLCDQCANHMQNMGLMYCPLCKGIVKQVFKSFRT